MSQHINYVFNNFAAVLVKGGEILEVKADEKPELFQRVVTLCMAGEKEEAFDLIVDSSNVRFITKRLAAITDGMLSVDVSSDEVIFTATDGRRIPIKDMFAQRVRTAWTTQDQVAIEVYKKFMIKASNNPNDISASDLFEFVTVNKLPLSTDGEVLAYKIVRADFLDIHSKTKNHTPGNVVEEAVVDYNRDVTCSNGLHFCSKDYLPQYGGSFGRGDTNRLVLVKINPADVAAFPRDYDNAKGRCRKYTVVSELPTAFFTAIVELMESVPYVDLTTLGTPTQVADRLGVQVKTHKETLKAVAAETTTHLVLDSIVYSSLYRWYVTVEGDNQPRKFVKAFETRGAARTYRDQLIAKMNGQSAVLGGSYLGITNPKIAVYDGDK